MTQAALMAWEEGVVARSKSGEAEFDAFLQAQWAPLVRLAYAITHDLGRAEDAVQEGFTRLWHRWRRLQHEAPAAYLRKIVVNEALSVWRRPWRRRETSAEQAGLELVSGSYPGPERVTSDDRAALTAALAELSPRQRAVVVLRYAEDLSEHMVAEILGCSIGSVKTHASRGLAKLRVAAPLHQESEI